MDVYIYAAPVFVLLIMFEIIYSSFISKKSSYTLYDTISNFGVGIFNVTNAVFFKFINIAIYVLVYENLAIIELPNNIYTLVFAVVFYDFLHYWRHRYLHEIGFLWAAHVCHHSGERFNLSTAVRIAGTTVFTQWMFYWPLALFGVDPLTIVLAGVINLVYQFWVHTENVGKLGWFEKHFITPSNHRVHHAKNDIYIDKNYGGIFTWWDKMFGTHQEELDDVKPVYGVRSPVMSWDPVWINLKLYSEMLKDTIDTEKWSDKIKIWLKGPGWRPQDVEYKNPKIKYDFEANYEPVVEQHSLNYKIYLGVQMFIVLAFGINFLIASKTLPLSESIMYFMVVLFNISAITRMFKLTYATFMLEIARVASLGLALYFYPNWFHSILPGQYAAYLASGYLLVCIMFVFLVLLSTQRSVEAEAIDIKALGAD